MAIFDELSGEDMMFLALVIAIATARVLDNEDLNTLGNFVVAVGGLMLAAAAQEQAVQAGRDEAKKADEQKDAAKEFEALKDKVAQLVRQQGGQNI